MPNANKGKKMFFKIHFPYYEYFFTKEEFADLCKILETARAGDNQFYSSKPSRIVSAASSLEVTVMDEEKLNEMIMESVIDPQEDGK